MTRYDIVMFCERFEDKKDVVPGCALFRLDGAGSRVVKSCVSLEEAQKELRKYSASVTPDGAFYEVVEYYILKKEYDDDGEDVTFCPENMGENMIPEGWDRE